MNSAYLADMERFALLTFTRQKLCAPLMEQIHRLLLLPLCDADRKRLNLVRRWLLCPYSVWGVDFKGLTETMCRQLCEVQQVDEDIVAVLQRLEDLPDEETQELIRNNERGIKAGDYNDFLTKGARDKYEARNQELQLNEEFKADFAALRRRFDLDNHYIPGRLLRRTLTGERNIRPDAFENRLETEQKRFEMALDSICVRHHLYGILESTPLLLKLSVNPTAHGLMIFIPAYWSFDYKRDLNWPEIQKLQKARSLRAIDIEFAAKLKRFAAADLEAKELGLVGDKKHVFLCQKIGVRIDTDESLLRRWRKQACLRLKNVQP